MVVLIICKQHKYNTTARIFITDVAYILSTFCIGIFKTHSNVGVLLDVL